MNDDMFGDVIGIARTIVSTSRIIALDAFPNGATLICHTCRRTYRVSTNDCARHLSIGWPVCCGSTMTAVRV